MLESKLFFNDKYRYMYNSRLMEECLVYGYLEEETTEGNKS